MLKYKSAKTPEATTSRELGMNATAESTTNKDRTGKDYFEKVDNMWQLTKKGELAANNLHVDSVSGLSSETTNRVKFVTFHQSYAYEDFIEGIKATTENGVISYNVEDGVFKEFCRDAEKDPDHNYLFIIDEINRGNISKIFGELITLIEPTKRLGQPEQLTVNLPYSGDEFGVPSNVYILGTMNTADRSITMMDTALRRRFDFIEMMPDTNVITQNVGTQGVIDGIDVAAILTTINRRIEYLYDRDHTVGHAFFVGVNNLDELQHVFENKVIPLLQEYFYEDYSKIQAVLNDNQGFYIYSDTQNVGDLFGSEFIAMASDYDDEAFKLRSHINAGSFRKFAENIVINKVTDADKNSVIYGTFGE